MENRKIIIFTGPSGVGKATIEKEIFKNKNLKLMLSISATTRAPRKGEKNKKQYYFISNKKFEFKIKNNEFIEWNYHFSNKYGTLKSEIKRIFDMGFNPFLEVEVEGAKKIIKKYNKKDIISIFISPSSIEQLKNRITLRGSESIDQLNQRLSRVKKEMNDKKNFDFIVYNDLLENAVEEVTNIIKKELS